ncbi:MAG: hypothetical protein GEU94_12840 [Micromonosporaceae bacterium]|nr:hypothetical protein [Micromonosporaceae bacterium]
MLPPAGLDGAAVRRVWPEILERTKKRRVVWSMLQNVMPRAVQGDVLVLDLQHGGLLPRFSDNEVIGVIQEALKDVLGVRWKIRCEVVGRGGRPAHAAAPGSGPPASGSPADPEGGPAQSPGQSRPGSKGVSEPASSAGGPQSSGRPQPAGSRRAAGERPTDKGNGAAAKPSRVNTGDDWDGVPLGEPPPEDPEPPRPAMYEGFDPGDHPLDDEPGAVPAVSPEEQAVALLQQTFGAERIDGGGPRAS